LGHRERLKEDKKVPFCGRQQIRVNEGGRNDDVLWTRGENDLDGGGLAELAKKRLGGGGGSKSKKMQSKTRHVDEPAVDIPEFES
jgi:hypothetical protein